MDNLLHSTEIGTIFLDRDLCIRKFTPQISGVFNLLPQDVGRRIDVFTHNIEEPQLLDQLRQVLETESPLEHEVCDHHGHWFFLRIFPYRSSTGDVEGVVVTLIDTSALKRAQAEVQDLHHQLTGILENSTSFICVKDLEGRFVLCNHASEEILGVAPEQARGRADADFLPTNVASLIRSHDLEVITSGRPAKFEEGIPQSDGDHTYLSVKFPLVDRSGVIYGLGAVCTDITERKRDEERQRLEVVRRDRFLAMLSHELRNPLAAIANAIRVLDRAPQADSEVKTRQIIGRQAQHLSRLLDDLLDVARVTQNKIELRNEVLDLRRTSQDAVDVVTPLFSRRQQTFSFDLPDEPLFVEADPARLQQLQVNLLTNASKYTPDQGEIGLRVRRDGSDALISVRDNGTGIETEMRQSIFDLFVQSDAASGNSDGGLGVGLTLVRSIVEKHGGRIDVHSDGLGTGSEFIVRLPLTDKRPSQMQPAGNAGVPSQVSVLIVEDNPDARESLRTLLELDGYRVSEAIDGRSALESIHRAPPQVALIDIGLPDIKGYEIARQIRANHAFDDVLLVALTGFGQEADREAAVAAGFDTHMVKPLDLDELSRLLADRQSTSVDCS
jgi:two-component system CheB/CheR fusion protein